MENRSKNWLMNSSDRLVRDLCVDWSLFRLFRLDKFGPTSADFAQFPFFPVFSTVVPMFFQRVFWVSGHDSQGHSVFACTGQSKENVRSLWAA
jgi:hypothetical protein